MKINKNPASQKRNMMQYLNFFIRISRPVLHVKRSGSGPILGTFCKISSHLILEPVFAGLKLTKNCYINMNISFSGKEAVLLKTGFTSLSYKLTVSERLSSQFHKIWTNSLLNWEKLETQNRLILRKNFLFFLSFSSMRKNWEVQLGQN